MSEKEEELVENVTYTTCKNAINLTDYGDSLPDLIKALEKLFCFLYSRKNKLDSQQKKELKKYFIISIKIQKAKYELRSEKSKEAAEITGNILKIALGDTPIPSSAKNKCKNRKPLKMVEDVGSEDENVSEGTARQFAISSMQRLKDKRKKEYDELVKISNKLYLYQKTKIQLIEKIKFVQNELSQPSLRGRAETLKLEKKLALYKKNLDLLKTKMNYPQTTNSANILAEKIRNKRIRGEAISTASSDDNNPLADKLVRSALRGRGINKYRTSPFLNDLEEYKPVVPPPQRGGRKTRKRRRKKKTKRKKKRRKRKRKTRRKRGGNEKAKEYWKKPTTQRWKENPLILTRTGQRLNWIYRTLKDGIPI